MEESASAQDDLLWRDPAHAVAGMLHIISTHLGGDLVVWATVDNATGVVTVVELADPLAPSQVLADLMTVSGAMTPSTLSKRLSGLDRSVLISDMDGAECPADSFPQVWFDHLRAHPVRGLIVVPLDMSGRTTGLLIAARRSQTERYTTDDLRFVESGARRLTGEGLEASAASDKVEARRLFRRLVAWRRRPFRAREVLLGVGLPGLVTLCLMAVDDATVYRPGVLMLLACVAAAVLGGVRAVALSGIVGTIALWWGFTPPQRSWMISSRNDIVGVVLFVAATIGVILLEYRLEQVRHSERLAQQLNTTLLDQSPIAMAVFDRQLRYQQVNEPMAVMNARSAPDHVGLKPGDISPLAGQLYEHLLKRVRDTGQAITDRELTILMPELGLERHWQVNYQPLRGVGSEVVGIGAAVTDVTQTVVMRRQAERLRELSDLLTTAVDEQQVADCVSAFLIETFQGRATVSWREGDHLVVAAVAGFGEEEAARRVGSRLMFDDDGPIADAARSNDAIVLSAPADILQRYPALDEIAAGSHDQASLSMPLRARPGGPAIGVMHIGWAALRPITHAMTTLAGTASSLVTLALARIIATREAHEVEFRLALDAMLDDVAVGRAVRDDDGEIVDFVIEFVNSHGSTGARRRTDVLVGKLICEIYPEWRASGMFDRFRAVVETGIPYQGHRVQYADATSADDRTARKDARIGNRRQAYWTLQVAKFGDGYISASRDVTEVVLAEEASRAAALQAAAERGAIVLLQAAALPRTLPVLPGVRIAAVYEPADPRQPVGGDWYDVFAIGDNLVALVIADVAGHGHSAAVFMVQVRNIFRAIAAEHTEPDDVLTRANDVTTQLNEPDGPFVTCCFAVLDIAARTLRWAQAGHFSPLIVHADGTTSYLDARPGAPLAFFEGEGYQTSSVDVRAGDRVLMFTDGLVERRREHLDIGLARLATLASSHADLPTQEFVEALAESVRQRFDDLALVCVDIVGI